MAFENLNTTHSSLSQLDHSFLLLLAFLSPQQRTLCNHILYGFLIHCITLDITNIIPNYCGSRCHYLSMDIFFSLRLNLCNYFRDSFIEIFYEILLVS
jgi:hypothetical protein